MQALSGCAIMDVDPEEFAGKYSGNRGVIRLRCIKEFAWFVFLATSGKIMNSSTLFML